MRYIVVVWLTMTILASTAWAQSQIDPQTREELRKTYRDVAKEMKRLAEEFRTFYDEMKSVFPEDEFEGVFSDEAGFGKADIIESDDEMIVKADVPGVAKDKVTVRLLDERLLEIEGEREAELSRRTESGGMTMVQSERSEGHFYKRFKLPARAAGEGFKADLADGVLTVRIPKEKKGPAAGAKTIPIS